MLACCEFNQTLNYVREKFLVMELHRSGKGLTPQKADSHYEEKRTNMKSR